jgi:hypothetical protein
MPRRQKDAVRQHLLEIQKDVETVLRIMTQPSKTGDDSIGRRTR